MQAFTELPILELQRDGSSGCSTLIAGATADTERSRADTLEQNCATDERCDACLLR